MRKILLLIAVLLGASGAWAQPSGAAYIYSGGSWTGAPTTETLGALNYKPPAIALYCYNTSTGLWAPADSLCFGGGGTTTNALTAAATGGAAPGSTFNGAAAVTIDYHSVGADVSGAAAAVLTTANTFTKNQAMPGLTLNSVANAAAPTGVATNSGQSVPASTTNEAAVTCIDSSGANTTLGTTSSNVTTTGGASYIVWSYTLPTGCTTGYIWMKTTGSFSYYSVASGTSFQQNAAATTYTAAASYPAGGVYPAANTTGQVTIGGNVAIGTTNPTDALYILKTAANGGVIVEEANLVNAYSPWFSLKKGSFQQYWSIAGSGSSFIPGATTGDMVFANYGSTNIDFGNNTTMFMTLLNSGNVGIGSIAPGSKLTVKGGDVFIDGGGPVMHDTVVTTNCYRITIASGLVTPTLVTCPTD